MKISIGIDAGSRTIKIVLLDADRFNVIASGIVDQGVEQNALATGLLNDLLEQSSIELEEVSRIVATGYGRHIVTVADEAITEITCHSRGVHCLIPNAATIIEIGGQDSKWIRLDGNGSVRDFSMNDRCAAGTGCFLEMVARRLSVPLERLGELAKQSQNRANISSMCVVFAETEIIGLLASGVAAEDIVAGVQTSIAKRIMSLAGRDLTEPLVFTGGVALIPGMREALETVLNRRITIPPSPQLTGALGAALIAAIHRRSAN